MQFLGHSFKENYLSFHLLPDGKIGHMMAGAEAFILGNEIEEIEAMC